MREHLASEFAKKFPAVLAQYSQFKIIDWFLAELHAPCEYCGHGDCENCMNTGLKYPEMRP